MEQNQTENQNQSKYSVSPDTEKFIDCLNALTEAYGSIIEAVEQHYGEEQVDTIMEQTIHAPYNALRDAVKSLLLESIEENISTKDSTEV